MTIRKHRKNVSRNVYIFSIRMKGLVKKAKLANYLKIIQELDLDLKCQHNCSNFIASKKSTAIISRQYLDYPFFVSKPEY